MVTGRDQSGLFSPRRLCPPRVMPDPQNTRGFNHSPRRSTHYVCLTIIGLPVSMHFATTSTSGGRWVSRVPTVPKGQASPSPYCRKPRAICWLRPSGMRRWAPPHPDPIDWLRRAPTAQRFSENPIQPHVIWAHSQGPVSDPLPYDPAPYPLPHDPTPDRGNHAASCTCGKLGETAPCTRQPNDRDEGTAGEQRKVLALPGDRAAMPDAAPTPSTELHFLNAYLLVTPIRRSRRPRQPRPKSQPAIIAARCTVFRSL
jgi:hypothetical protein